MSFRFRLRVRFGVALVWHRILRAIVGRGPDASGSVGECVDPPLDSAGDLGGGRWL